MATQNDFSRGFQVNSAMSAFVRVSVSTNGFVGPASNAVKGVGINQKDVTAAAYETATVRFYETGTFKVVVTGVPVTVGDVLYAAALGAVAGTGTVAIGTSLESASANGTIIEVAN